MILQSTPSTAATVPVVTFTASLGGLSRVADFTTTLQQNFRYAILATLPDNSAATVTLSNFRLGSVVVDTAITFLNGDTATANNLAQALQVTSKSKRQQSVAIDSWLPCE